MLFCGNIHGSRKSAFFRTCSLENADKYAKNRTDILNLRGLCYISLGKLEEAENVYKSIIKTNFKC